MCFVLLHLGVFPHWVWASSRVMYHIYEPQKPNVPKPIFTSEYYAIATFYLSILTDFFLPIVFTSCSSDFIS